MTPPIWLDEAGRRCPTTIHCPWCGRETALFRQRGAHFFRRPDWRPFQVERSPSWCGHTIPKVSVPAGRGWWQAVLVWEPGQQPPNPLERHEPVEQL